MSYSRQEGRQECFLLQGSCPGLCQCSSNIQTAWLVGCRSRSVGTTNQRLVMMLAMFFLESDSVSVLMVVNLIRGGDYGQVCG